MATSVPTTPAEKANVVLARELRAAEFECMNEPYKLIGGAKVIRFIIKEGGFDNVLKKMAEKGWKQQGSVSAHPSLEIYGGKQAVLARGKWQVLLIGSDDPSSSKKIMNFLVVQKFPAEVQDMNLSSGKSSKRPTIKVDFPQPEMVETTLPAVGGKK